MQNYMLTNAYGSLAKDHYLKRMPIVLRNDNEPPKPPKKVKIIWDDNEQVKKIRIIRDD
jgi:hypothetical protein